MCKYKSMLVYWVKFLKIDFISLSGTLLFQKILLESMNNSSLFFEMLMYLNSYYFGAFAVCELLITVFKMVNLPYPNRNIVLELMITLLLCCIEYARVFLGRKGNFTKKVAPLVMSLFLTVPSSLGVVYLMLWQTYVLRLEIIMCSIQLCMESVETVLSLINIGTFYKCNNY